MSKKDADTSFGVSRREFLGAAAALGASAALPRSAFAAEGLTIANWGGPAVDSFKAAWADPYTEETGIPITIDGSGPSLGRIRAMVESRAVTWDLCDANAGEAAFLGELGLLEEIDWTVVDQSKTFPETWQPWGVSHYLFSYVLTYNSELVPGAPKSWADFWDIEKFPGRRGLRKNVTGMCECAMLADGVPPSEVYVELAKSDGIQRAMNKFREIKDHVIFWESGAQSVQLLRDQEVVMSNIWNTRAIGLHHETNGKTTWIWDGGLLIPSVWSIPKGNPAGKRAAEEFANWSLNPQSQIKLLEMTGNGPSNPATLALVPEELKWLNPTQPENRAKQFFVDVQWYNEFQDAARDAYLEMQGS